MEKAEQLQKLHTKWLSACHCELQKTATQGVSGYGNPNAEIVFIGEAPGAKEDKEGRPFVGAAGKFLDEMLASIKMKREDVYITNIVKYRPPENRDPTQKEKDDCINWLEEEIKIIEPILIVFLGRHSMNHFFPNKKISEDHGVLSTEKFFNKLYNFLPLYHPAAALYNGALRETLKEDFSRIPKLLKMLNKGKDCDSTL